MPFILLSVGVLVVAVGLFVAWLGRINLHQVEEPYKQRYEGRPVAWIAYFGGAIFIALGVLTLVASVVSAMLTWVWKV